MKQFLCLILVFASLTLCGFALAANSTQTISCPEQQFSLVCDSAYNWTYDSANGITIYTDHAGSIPYVLVFRSEDWLVDVADYVHEQYTPYIQKQYGENLVSYTEFKDYTIGGRKMQAAALYTYKLQGYLIDMLRVYDVQDKHTVVFTAKYIQGRGEATLRTLEQAVLSYQPNANYYGGAASGIDLIDIPDAPKQTTSSNMDYLFNSNGVSVDMLEIVPSLSKNYVATLRINIHLVNHSGKQVYFDLENASINGVPVKGIGTYNVDDGTDKDTFFLLKPETDAAIREACNSRETTFDLVLKDNKTYKEIERKNITLSLSSVPSFTPYPTEAATPTPRPTAKPTAKPVEQQKSTTSISNPNRSFYGISSMSFSDRLWANWDKKPGDMLNIRFEVLAKSRQVKSFVLYLYAVDDWGDWIYRQPYTWTTNRQIARGVTAFSDYIMISDYSRIKTIYCGIKRVTFTEGPDEEVSDDDIQYYYWDLR